MTMTKSDPEREERRREQKEIAESLKESGALDEIFARIDAGEPLTGHAGLLKGMRQGGAVARERVHVVRERPPIVASNDGSQPGRLIGAST